MHPPSSLPSAVVDGAVRLDDGTTVSVLTWPAEDDLRRKMSRLGQPRVLVVDAAVAAPELLDQLEDWVRAPLDPAELVARAKALVARAPAAEVVAPLLDADGVLHVGQAWVGIPPGQVAVMRLLLDNLNRVVRTEAIAEACRSAGASGHPASVRTGLNRLRVRIDPLGLELVTVRRRGMVLRFAGS